MNASLFGRFQHHWISILRRYVAYTFLRQGLMLGERVEKQGRVPNHLFHSRDMIFFYISLGSIIFRLYTLNV